MSSRHGRAGAACQRLQEPTDGLVDIVSGSFGAGHDAAALAIAGQLHQRGFSTRTWDVVDLMPGRLGRMLRSGYLKQIQSMPATWRWTFHGIERHEIIAQMVIRALQATEGALLEIAADRPDQFVSTHPFSSQALGHLRAQGRLTVPVTTYLTDMSVHRLWVHQGVDLHLAVHDLAAHQARDLGAQTTRTVTAAVSPAFGDVVHSRRAKVQARKRFGFPCGGPRLALVTGGAYGIGQLFESAADLAATGLVTPVVLCGTNSGLLARVRGHAGMIGLGWVADMAQLLTAVDVVVQNSGGMTSQETCAAGVPMLTYRCIAAHGETNAAALDVAGLAGWVRSRDALPLALSQALHSSAPATQPDAYLPDVVEALFPAAALIA